MNPLASLVRGWKRMGEAPGREKSRLRMLLEMTVWLIRKREWPRFYFEYGFHKRGRSSRSYMEIPRFKRINYELNTRVGTDHRAIRHLKADIHYLVLVRDKLIFNEFLRGLGIPTPVNLCLLSQDELLWLRTGRAERLEEIVQHSLEGFLKSVLGESGEEIARLRCGGGRLFLNDQEAGVDALRRFIRPRAILQEAIVQHPEISRLHPHAVNTIRLTTVNSGERIVPFAAVMRIGSGRNFTDNISRGGVGVPIDIANGRLRERGHIFKPRFDEVPAHPESGIVFAGFAIPFFTEALAMAERAHRCMYGLFSIGWDIAITPTGPVFIEGNDNWSMRGHQIGVPRGLKAEYENYASMFARHVDAARTR